MFAISYLATVRRDGSPRLHPFCPILADGRLFAAIPRSSPKGWDLRRHPRCAIHALPGPEDDEFSIRASALEVTDDAPKRALVRDIVVNSRVGGMIKTVSNDPLFEFDSNRSTSRGGSTSVNPVPVLFVVSGEPSKTEAGARPPACVSLYDHHVLANERSSRVIVSVAMCSTR